MVRTRTSLGLQHDVCRDPNEPTYSRRGLGRERGTRTGLGVHAGHPHGDHRGDEASRTVTLKGSQGSVEIKVADQMEGFNTLKVGDTVDVTYYESLLVNVSRPPK
jgi:hypothetical protein